MAQNGSPRSASVPHNMPPASRNHPGHHDHHAPSHGTSPPRTPSSQKARSKGTVRARPRLVLHDTLTTDTARGEEAVDHHASVADLHDLAWSPKNTRDSVVDNMLQSLDQLSNGDSPTMRASHRHCSAVEGDESYSPDPRITFRARAPRTRGHTFSSSLSSDKTTDRAYDFLAEGTAQHSSNPSLARGHRSNTSSSFQSGLGRIDSIRAAEPDETKKKKHLAAGRGTATGAKADAPRSRGRRSSRSSVTSSVDFANQMGGPRWQRAVERRSSSFDHSYRPPETAFALFTTRPPTLPYDNYDAAPNPTVPAGPRRERGPPTASTFPLPSPRLGTQAVPQLRRKSSQRSPTTLFGRHERAGLADDGAARERNRLQSRQQSRQHTRNNSRETPTFPTSITTSPHRSPIGISHEHPPASPSVVAGNQTKERPGFFRRVFGSSRTTVPTGLELPAPAMPSARNLSRSASRNDHVANSFPAGRWLKAASPALLAKDTPHGTLNKKTSFFRRRKKSVSEDNPMPTLMQPPPLQPKMEEPLRAQLPETSPVSSLREVMSPFLHSPTALRRQRVEQSSGVMGMPSKQLDSLSSRLVTAGEWQPGADDLHAERPEKVTNRLPSQPTRRKRSVPDEVVGDGTMMAGAGSLAPAGYDHEIPESPKTVTTAQSTGAAFEPVKSSDGVVAIPPTRFSNNENERPMKSVQPARSSSNKDLPIVRRDPLSANKADGATSRSGFVDVPVRTRSKDWHQRTPTKSDASPNVMARLPTRIIPHDKASEEVIATASTLPPPLEISRSSARTSTSSTYKSASSKLPTPTVEINFPAHFASLPIDANLAQESPLAPSDDPSEAHRLLAKKILDGDQDVVDSAVAASWFGEAGQERAMVRKAYMELFDWQNINILAALRGLCSRLLLKAESQQVDRILDAFSVRWCACNPNHGFKATDVVHTICFSIILLNTDLYAGPDSKMTRSQFIKNTLPTIRRVAADAAPNAFETPARSTFPVLPPGSPAANMEPPSPVARAATSPSESGDTHTAHDGRRPVDRLATRPSDHSGRNSIEGSGPTPHDYDSPADDCGPLVRTPFHGKLSTWEGQVEIALKDFYNSIRQHRLPLYGCDEVDKAVDPAPAHGNFAALNSMLRRTPSLLSKAGSETHPTRGRLHEKRMNTSRWPSKIRSRPRLYPPSMVPSGRTSLDDESSMMSPAASSIWSKYSLGKTQTSMSLNSLASSFPQADYQKSIGFANALSQAIIREEAIGANNADDTLRVAPLLEDESLELAGAPWAKEGILKHKYHLEGFDKKAKDRNWTECFAVIEKGWMRLFRFNMNAKSTRLKTKNQKLPGGVVGGGNWLENAEDLGKFLLRQTIASALPPPGYSKSRPFVWALSLPQGAVHLFQVGTPEIVKEFVTTANYWSARLSKEPLVGGVSNIEYGWSDGIISFAMLSTGNRPGSNTNTGSRQSLQNSIRSSMDQGNIRPKLPGDRVIISDWMPPAQSMHTSALMEVDQLKGLTGYVKNIEGELQKHNELRSTMLVAFSPRHPNHVKAMGNWERKSSYLLREIVKFRTYIDCLQAAQTQKDAIHAERDAAAPVLKEDAPEGDDGTDGATIEKEALVTAASDTVGCVE